MYGNERFSDPVRRFCRSEQRLDQLVSDLQSAHADLGHQTGDFPISEAAAREVLSLPIYPEMPVWHVDQVAAALEYAYVS